jgi:transposase-like protein
MESVVSDPDNYRIDPFNYSADIGKSMILSIGGIVLEKDIMIHFSTKVLYEEFVKNIKWGASVYCPFCKSKANSKIGNSFRYHCNSCNSDYSLSVNTIMHRTRVDMRKWFMALDIYLSQDKISYRELASKINVNKNTAHRILTKLQNLFNNHKMDVVKILGYDIPHFELLTKVLLINIKSRR